MKYILIILVMLYVGCDKNETIIDNGYCIQRCVNHMISLMNASDHNQFTGSSLKEVQKICKENLSKTNCVVDCRHNSQLCK